MLEFQQVGFARAGLWCRGGCERSFHPADDTVPEIVAAGLERNVHELLEHNYLHVPIDTQRPQWTNPSGRGFKART